VVPDPSEPGNIEWDVSVFPRFEQLPMHALGGLNSPLGSQGLFEPEERIAIARKPIQVIPKHLFGPGRFTDLKQGATVTLPSRQRPKSGLHIR
jgi:hypothetical protein